MAAASTPLLPSDDLTSIIRHETNETLERPCVRRKGQRILSFVLVELKRSPFDENVASSTDGT